jgi:3-hydroxyisobutyrate dehydrogenase
MTVIGFAGLGRMGGPMCANLVRAGYPVVVTDLRPECEQVAHSLGARWSASTEGAAAGADVFVTMLPGPPEVHDALLGAGAALAALAPGATWIDMSSNSPSAAEPIQRRARERGVHTLEAPVGGGIPAARDGSLQLFAAGEAAVFADQLALLEVLGDPARIRHLGAHGAGYTAKLLVNLLWFGQAIAAGEALLLARAAGLDLRVLHEVLNSSSAASTFLRRDLPALLGGDYLESFGLDRICEELGALDAMASAHGVPFELSDLVSRTHRRALEHFGPRNGELLAVALLEEQAGTRLRYDS